MTKYHRRAEWIWRGRGAVADVPFNTANPRVAEEANRYVYFRRTFYLDGETDEAKVQVSADGRYKLFVNGQFVGRGPARCSSSWQYVDEYDVASFLRPGTNVIAALVHSYGRHTAWYELPSWEHARAFGCGGFFLQGDAAGTRLDTGESWNYFESEAWQRDVPSGSLGFIEVYDARRVPSGWNQVDHDDSAWETAEILRAPARNFAGDVIPFPVMVPRDIPHLSEELRLPEKLVYVGEVDNAPPAADVATLFEREPPSDLDRCRADNLTALLRSDGYTSISTTEGQSVTIVLDYGQTIPGRVHFDLDGPAGAILDFTYSERLHADNRVHMHQGIPGFDILAAHRLTLRSGRQTWEAFELSGFRYLQVTVRNCQQPLHIHAIHLNFSAYPVEATGQFSCSDEKLNRIWRVGANTLNHCMLDGYVDCPGREQRQWLDAYVDSLINYMAFGDPHLAAKMLRQVAQSQRPDGITTMVAPGDFSVLDFSNIPDFCLYWILAIGAYIDYVGDMEIVDELYPSVTKAIDWFKRHLNQEMLLTDVPHWVFVDWAELDKHGQVTALNAQFVAGLRVAQRMAEIVNAPRDANAFEQLAAGVSEAINTHLWNEKRGVYVDSRRHGVQSGRISQQNNAAVMAYGVAPRPRWSRIFDAILDERRLVLTRFGNAQTTEVAFDEGKNVVLAQPFYMHFLHRALSRAGMHQVMLDNIRHRWGAMVDEGDKTFRESWQVIELTSLCHAWAGTPTFDLSTEVLGVKPVEPGFRVFHVAPHPVDLDWAKGVVPTPHGGISVEWHREKGRFIAEITVPQGTKAEFRPPELSGESWQTVAVDGESADVGEQAISLAAGTHIVACDNNGGIAGA